MKYKTYTDPKIENQQTKPLASTETCARFNFVNKDKTVDGQETGLGCSCSMLSNQSPDFIQNKIKEIHKKILNKQYVTYGTLKRLTDKYIEYGKKRAIEDEIKLINKEERKGIYCFKHIEAMEIIKLKLKEMK